MGGEGVGGEGVSGEGVGYEGGVVVEKARLCWRDGETGWWRPANSDGASTFS